MRAFHLVFLTREGCSICSQAQKLVEPEVHRLGGRLDVIDVDDQARFRTRFGERVPVLLTSDGVVLAEGVFDRRAIRKKLKGREVRTILRRPQ